MRLMTVVAAASLALAAWTNGASASTITQTVDFSATNFTTIHGSPVPTDPVTGSFKVTFDPSFGPTDDTTHIVVNSLNIPVDSTIGFTYYTNLQFGGISYGTNGVISTGIESDFALTFAEDLSYGHLMYVRKGAADLFETFDVTFNISPVTATPIPASLVMLLTALGALGGAGYLRGRKAQLAA